MKKIIKSNANNSSKITAFNVGKSTVSGYRCDTLSESKNAPLFDITLNFCDESNLVSQKRYSEADRLLDKLYADHESTQHTEDNPEFHNFATKLGSKYSLSNQSKVLEIGCNCGAFLKILRDKTNANVIGVEPSTTMEKIWAERNLTVINEYLDTASTEILKTKGPFDIIYFRHVFEHVPDPVEFIRLAQSILAEDGAIVLETPYLGSIFKYGRYENISYSHLNLFSIKSLDMIFRQFDMGMTEYELVKNDGGSFITHFKRNINTNPSLFEEDLKSRLSDFLAYGKELRKTAQQELQKYKNGEVVGYGAGAKGQHLIHVLGLNKYIKNVVDDTLGFKGKFIPGTDIEIVNSDFLKEKTIAAVINLAPTHYETIKSKVPPHLDFIDFINE